MFKIYALKLKESEEYRYIGRTKERLSTRLSKHKINAKLSKRKTHRCNWILKNIDNIEIVIIEDNIDTYEESCEKEIHYISVFREKYNIVNSTNGGDGGCPGYKHTEEALRKISETHKGKKLSEETRKKISKRVITEETRRLLSIKSKENCKGEKNPMFGKKRPDTTELNRKRTGWKQKDEVIKRMSESRKGDLNSNCKIKSENRKKIVDMYLSGEYNSTQLAKMYNVSNTTILRIIKEDRNKLDILNI